MPCEAIQEFLLDGLKSPLPEGFDTHLETCAECRELWDTWQALGEVPSPDPGLSARFRSRLLREGPQKPAVHRLTGWGLPLAATFLILLGSAFAAGYALRGKPEPSTPQQAALEGLRRGSPTDRMQAIALVTSPRSGDPDLVEALMERVTRDPNPEVRLAAVEALYLFGSDLSLGQRLAKALPHQDSPRVQLALVDLLVALRERRASEALRRLLREERLGPDVRRHAESRLTEARL